jgi:hypothetical protein
MTAATTAATITGMTAAATITAVTTAAMTAATTAEMTAAVTIAESRTGAVLAPGPSVPPPRPRSATSAGAATAGQGNATKPSFGTESTTQCQSESQAVSSSRTGPRSAGLSTPARAIETNPPITTRARFAALPATELKRALDRRNEHPLTPYSADAFEARLSEAKLLDVYPNLVAGLRRGFDAKIPSITNSYIPPQLSVSIDTHPAFADLVRDELDKGRYIGPATISDIKSILGPIHISPCYLVPKPRKPDKMRLVQDFSSPHQKSRSGARGPPETASALPRVMSINSGLDISDHSCTYGTKWAFGLTIWSLPSDSQIAIRDVEAAYRTMALVFAQLPGVAIRISEHLAVVDTCLAFGLVPSGGIFGLLADALCDILRFAGIGPVLKWVDDFVFARVKTIHLAEINDRRAELRARIKKRNGGKVRAIKRRGRTWFEGQTYDDGTADEFVEDFRFPLRDLVRDRAVEPADSGFAYTFDDINRICSELGIPWALLKDLLFAPANVYHGMVWDVCKRTVALEESTRLRYLACAREWLAKRVHTLAEARILAGRLQHCTYLVPRGRPYISHLYRFIRLYGIVDASGRPEHDPSKPLTPGHGCPAEIEWWVRELSKPNVTRIIPRPVDVLDVRAYSDASSEIGIGIVIADGLWGAWRLIPGWKTARPYKRDIQWAEAIGFELACRYVFGVLKLGVHIRFWCDNQGVTEAWWKRRSGNEAVNEVFKRLGDYLESAGGHAYTRYVESARNPADGPSQSDFSGLREDRVLPELDLPPDLAPFVVDHRRPFSPAELVAERAPAPRPDLPAAERKRRADATHALSVFHADLAGDPSIWWEDGPDC